MFLHAWKLSLPHPISDRPLRVVAPVPDELLAVLRKMNLAPPAGVGEPER
jgi:23S rRNA pseudouridine955/2504/2580 synthase